MVGSTLAGFNIVERISRGGTADIYLATDTVENRYTLRVLLPELQSNWTRSRQFTNGCKILNKMNHPNVIHLYQIGKTEDGLPYAVLEYIEGSNLKEKILRNDHGLTENRMRLLLGMAAALAHVHERQYLHLDFKPENILVGRHYEPRLIDFDLAVPRPEVPKRLSSPSGTLAYWAPEQIAKEPVDERADIFAFGVTAYEMLSGKKPITGTTREEILEKYADFNRHLVPLRERVPHVPPALERTLTKCLEKDLTRRYPSMSLVIRDLRT